MSESLYGLLAIPIKHKSWMGACLLRSTTTAMTELSTDDLITGWLVAEEGALSANASPKKLAERIEKRSELTLLGLVKMLGPTLVAEAPEKRGRGDLDILLVVSLSFLADRVPRQVWDFWQQHSRSCLPLL